MNLYSLFLIMKWLLVKLLLPFRKVSKQYHLLVSYELDNVKTYTSIVDDKTFPEQKFPLTAPESLSSLRETLTLASDAGLLCFCGYYGDLDAKKTRRAVIWNPTVGKSVGIDVNPNTGYGRNVVGFGVCHDDPKLVNISVNKESKMWEVDVFKLSTRVWKNVYADVAFKNLGDLECAKVSVNGVIYFRAYDDINLPLDIRSNFVISFDLKSEKFGEVCLPEILVDARILHVAKVNESLGLLDYHNDDKNILKVCDVWTRKDGANKPFTKIYTVNVEGNLWFSRILEFRNNGEVVRELDGSNDKSRLDVYEPLSRHYRDVGIDGRLGKFSVRSYPETPLLLDQPESDVIIH